MHDEIDYSDDPQKKSRRPTAKIEKTPRVTHTTRFQKKTTGFGGAHRRRNKHWNW